MNGMVAPSSSRESVCRFVFRYAENGSYHAVKDLCHVSFFLIMSAKVRKTIFPTAFCEFYYIFALFTWYLYINRTTK